MLVHLDGIDASSPLDRLLEQSPPRPLVRAGPLAARFRGISTLTALGLIAEIGDFAASPPARARVLARDHPSEYSSGDQQHRGHITKAGNRHARRLLIEAAWHYRHPPTRAPRQRAARPPDAPARLASPDPPAPRHRHLTDHGKRSTVVNVAVARELAGFLWADMTDSPRDQTTRHATSAGRPRRLKPHNDPALGPGGRRDPPGGPSIGLCDPDSRP